MELNAKSQLKLSRVHPDLQRVIQRAAEITTVEFIVTCGERTLEEQKKLYEQGTTKTLKSRHIPENNLCGMSCAVDIAIMEDGKITWDYSKYEKFSHIVKEAASQVDVKIEWGGDWLKFKDGPHYQLPKGY